MTRRSAPASGAMVEAETPSGGRCEAANISISSAGDCCGLRAVARVNGVRLCRTHARAAQFELFEKALERIAAMAPQIADEEFEADAPVVHAVGTALLALEEGGVVPEVNPKVRRATAHVRGRLEARPDAAPAAMGSPAAAPRRAVQADEAPRG